jgi:gliding motility-associated-like protein
VGVFYNEVEFGFSDTLLCMGTAVDLSVLDSNYAGNVSFVWSTGDTSQIALPWTVGPDTTLWFTATDRFGNTCSDTIHIRSLQYNSPPGGLTLLNCDTTNLVQRLYTAFQWPLPDEYSIRWHGTWDSAAFTFQGWVAFDARFGGCWVRDSIPVYVGSPLGITPPGPNYCLGTTVTFSTAHPHSGYRYLWSTGDTTATTSQLIQSTGFIKLQVTDDLGMTCSDSISYVGGNSVVATLTPAVINGVQPWTDTAFGTATGAHKFYWMYNGDTLGSGFGISDSLIHTWNLASSGNLYFVGIDTIFGCADTATAQVVISQNYPAYIPNAFTPNANNTNDAWTVQLLNIDNRVHRAWIFNRFGGLVYQVENDEVSWQGTSPNGTPAESGAYVYVLEYTDLNGRFYRVTGTVNLIR